MMICSSGHLSDGLGNMQSWTFDYLALGCEMFVHTSPCVLWMVDVLWVRIGSKPCPFQNGETRVGIRLLPGSSSKGKF